MRIISEAATEATALATYVDKHFIQTPRVGKRKYARGPPVQGMGDNLELGTVKLGRQKPSSTTWSWWEELNVEAHEGDNDVQGAFGESGNDHGGGVGCPIPTTVTLFQEMGHDPAHQDMGTGHRTVTLPRYLTKSTNYMPPKKPTTPMWKWRKYSHRTLQEVPAQDQILTRVEYADIAVRDETEGAKRQKRVHKATDYGQGKRYNFPKDFARTDNDLLVQSVKTENKTKDGYVCPAMLPGKVIAPFTGPRPNTADGSPRKSRPTSASKIKPGAITEEDSRDPLMSNLLKASLEERMNQLKQSGEKHQATSSIVQFLGMEANPATTNKIKHSNSDGLWNADLREYFASKPVAPDTPHPKYDRLGRDERHHKISASGQRQRRIFWTGDNAVVRGGAVQGTGNDDGTGTQVTQHKARGEKEKEKEMMDGEEEEKRYPESRELVVYNSNSIDPSERGLKGSKESVVLLGNFVLVEPPSQGRDVNARRVGVKGGERGEDEKGEEKTSRNVSKERRRREGDKEEVLLKKNNVYIPPVFTGSKNVGKENDGGFYIKGQNSARLEYNKEKDKDDDVQGDKGKDKGDRGVKEKDKNEKIVKGKFLGWGFTHAYSSSLGRTKSEESNPPTDVIKTKGARGERGIMGGTGSKGKVIDNDKGKYEYMYAHEELDLMIRNKELIGKRTYGGGAASCGPADEDPSTNQDAFKDRLAKGCVSKADSVAINEKLTKLTKK